MRYRLIIIVAILLTASSVRAAPTIPVIPACGSTILNYFPVSRIESITGRPVKNTGAFRKLDYGAKQFDVCSYVFEGQNNFIIGSFWEMDSSTKAAALYTQLVETYQGDKNGVKIPAQKTSLDIGDKSTLALLKDFPKGNLKYDFNTIFTLNDSTVLFLSSDTSVISLAGLEELMRGAVGRKSSRPTTTLSPQPVSPLTFPASKTQKSSWISNNWKISAGAGGAAVILSLLVWWLWTKRKASLSFPKQTDSQENILPPEKNTPPPSELPPAPPQ